MPLPLLLPLLLVLAIPQGTARAAHPAMAQRWGTLTEVSFQHLTQDNGLPNEIATAVLQDREGFIWVGTMGGLARWDGYRFQVYRADARIPGALPDSVIQVLHSDAGGRLWVGTSAAGLARYERGRGRFAVVGAGPEGLSHVSVRALADDGAGGLWVGTEGGLDHVDARGTIHRQRGPGAEPVRALLRDSRGRLWVGTPRGLFRREAVGDSFEAVRLEGSAGLQPEPQSLLEDDRGGIWIGTLKNGAFRIAPGSEDPAPVVSHLPAEAGPPLSGQQIMAIGQARDGEVWIGTVSQGLYVVEPASGRVRRIRNRPALPVSLPDNCVRSLHRDRSGLVWVATNRGVSRHDPRQSAVLTMFGVPIGGAGESAETAVTRTIEVSRILSTEPGPVWLGTLSHGVEIIDPVGGRIGALKPDASRPETALPVESVLALEPAPGGDVFIGSKRGLYRASADGRRLARVPVTGRDPAASTWALHVEGSVLWIGGQTDGLWKLDLHSGRAEPVLRAALKPLTDERITVLASAAGGGLWVGTRNGLNRFDPGTGEVQSILPAPGRPGGLSGGFITALFTDRQSRLWIGTYGGGISVMDPGAPLSEPRFSPLGIEQGLPDNSVNALLEDAQGQIWASTDDGLAMIDPRTFQVRALRRAEGAFFSTYWTGSAARTPQGELLFGGGGGMTIVRPEQLTPWSYRPEVVVTDIRLGGKPAPIGRPETGAASRPEPLVVTPQANSLSVEFSATDYSAPHRNRYAHRLDGLDPDWVETDATRRLASYAQLPPGDYRLLLRASNRDGVWAESVVSLPVHVLPAWHQTAWFRAAAGLALLLAVAAVVQLRTRVLQARQRELEDRIRERTAELLEMSRALHEKSRILERSSITDPLTGLHNRRFLTEHIDADIAASARRAQAARAAGQGGPVDTDNVFYLVDVDHFKRVNDQHGHAAGDAVLVECGRRLRSALRDSDSLVRWGGEEFLAVARNTDRARAEELAERIRLAICSEPFVLEDGRSLPVSCSVGFASLPFAPGHPLAVGWQEVIELADVALYAAKRSGRDAWVGLLARSDSEPASWLPGLREHPRAAAERGEIGVVSNRETRAVLEALSLGEARA